MLSSLVWFLPLFISMCTSDLDFNYHNNSVLLNYLNDVVKNNNSAIKTHHLYTIGEKFPFSVLELTNAPKEEEFLPNIKLIGTIYGNEVVGREILLHFIDHLISNYAKNTTIQWLLNHTRIHILPNFNPDGFIDSSSIKSPTCNINYGKFDHFYLDLNSRFLNTTNHIPHQTKATIKWMSDIPFILSGAFYAGNIVASYPLQRLWKNAPSPPSPDDDVFQHLATVYATKHAIMHKGINCDRDNKKRTFKEGIVRATELWSMNNNMMDYNYFEHGTMELGLRVSCCNFPSESKLEEYWEHNKESLISFCMEALRGISGKVVDKFTNQPIENARLQVIGRDNVFLSKKNGKFWRLLLPNTYKLKASANGYYNYYTTFEVKSYYSFPELNILTVAMINSSSITTTTTTETTTTVATTSREEEKHHESDIPKINTTPKIPLAATSSAFTLNNYHSISMLLILIFGVF